jgi:hypothetical protein
MDDYEEHTTPEQVKFTVSVSEMIPTPDFI